jgi:FtsH-binding integral membrane protein
MSYDPNSQSHPTGYAAGSVIDAGLQSFMQRVYQTMGLGLVVTAATAYGVASSEQLMALFFGTPLKWVVMFAPFVILLFGLTPSRMASMSSGTLSMIFAGFSALMGISLSFIFQVYTGTSIVRVFFITAAMFAGTSLYGYTTRRDLTSMGSFMMMGLIGIVIASLVNLFMQSAMMQFVTSVLGVVIFTGLAAWNTQMLKSTYRAGDSEDNSKLAITGALNLYLDFINLFMSLLRLFGERR